MPLTDNPSAQYPPLQVVIDLSKEHDATVERGQPTFMRKLIKITGKDSGNLGNRIRGCRPASAKVCRELHPVICEIMGRDFTLRELFPSIKEFQREVRMGLHYARIVNGVFTPIAPTGAIAILCASDLADSPIRYTLGESQPTATVGFLLPTIPQKIPLAEGSTPNFWGRQGRLQYSFVG
jgi:hypothetical protein